MSVEGIISTFVVAALGSQILIYPFFLLKFSDNPAHVIEKLLRFSSKAKIKREAWPLLPPLHWLDRPQGGHEVRNYSVGPCQKGSQNQLENS